MQAYLCQGDALLELKQFDLAENPTLPRESSPIPTSSRTMSHESSPSPSNQKDSKATQTSDEELEYVTLTEMGSNIRKDEQHETDEDILDQPVAAGTRRRKCAMCTWMTLTDATRHTGNAQMVYTWMDFA